MNNRRDFLKKTFSYGCLFSVLGSLNFLAPSKSLSMKFINRNFDLMGTSGNIQIYIKDDIYGDYIIEKAINRMKEIELDLTKFSPYSCIGMINNNPMSYVEVTNYTLDVLKLGININKYTDNHFDMGMGNLLYHSGIDNTVPLVGNVTTINDMKHDLLFIAKNKVKLNRDNVMLDLGGIGKGYAVDLAANIFLQNGIKHFVINLGGDIRVGGGKPNGAPWHISIDKKISNLFLNKISNINLFDGSLAVSGSYLKKSRLNNNSIKHHIIDPNFLVSRDYYSLIIVIGKMASICDALSTACYNMNSNYLSATKNKFFDYNVNVFV